MSTTLELTQRLHDIRHVFVEAKRCYDEPYPLMSLWLWLAAGLLGLFLCLFWAPLSGQPLLAAALGLGSGAALYRAAKGYRQYTGTRQLETQSLQLSAAALRHTVHEAQRHLDHQPPGEMTNRLKREIQAAKAHLGPPKHT